MQSARFLIAAAAMAFAANASADPVLAPPAVPGAEVQPFVKVPAGRIAITHVRVIDGLAYGFRRGRASLPRRGHAI